MHAIVDHRDQDLARTAEFAETREYQANGLLQAYIGIEPETVIPVPDIAEGHRDAQFAALCLGAGSFVHASTQHPEFELAYAPLHAEQQAVVRQSRIVDSVQIDHACIDFAAQLEQPMPVRPVARQAGRLQAKHGAHMAGAQIVDQALESGTLHSPACGSSQILVDHLYFAESPTPRDVDKLILPTLASRLSWTCA